MAGLRIARRRFAPRGPGNAIRRGRPGGDAPASTKKRAGKPAQALGINHRKRRARSARTPGGWGAEESGAFADRALRDLGIASYRGAPWAELGRYYEFS